MDNSLKIAVHDIRPERIKNLSNRQAVAGDFVLYWMQQSQRARENHALEYAVRKANAFRLPVAVCFGLTGDYPDANLRHYAFMLEGLAEAGRDLARRGISFTVRKGAPPDVALAVGRRAAAIVCDAGYTRYQKEWRSAVARGARCSVEQVESDVIVPVGLASDKHEASARTFRPKVLGLYKTYLRELRPLTPEFPLRSIVIKGLDIQDTRSVLEGLSVDTGVKPVAAFSGGTDEATRRLDLFIRTGLAGYAAHRMRPETDYVSHMSPYLHFGQISPAYIARKVLSTRRGRVEDRERYLDELIVRRELSFNFVNFTPDYDRYSCVPAWARRTLAAHAADRRPFIYTRRQLEDAKTHDPYWNAAMNEMKYTGYMHNYMRMYWGKQIVEWSPTPEIAFKTALAINNKYFIDGRDPNSFANIAWLFGLHDRPWPPREIYGNVRTMTAGGLERKADPRAYVEKVSGLMKKFPLP